QNRVSNLRFLPDELQQVAFDQDSLGVLQLKEILDLPLLRSPRRGFRKMVAPEDDVLRNQTLNRRIRSAQDEVFSRPFEIVVLDRVRTRTVPAGNRLRILTNRLD